MALDIGWFIGTYKRKNSTRMPIRYCVIEDYSNLILADNGSYVYGEVLGNFAIIKVKASTATIATIANDSNVTQIPLTSIDDSLATLSNNQRNAIRNQVLSAGYTSAEFSAAIPDLTNATLRQVFKFLASRKQEPRYDKVTDTIVFDGLIDACRSIEELDMAVQ